MKAIASTILIATFSTVLAGCWFYSRPDTTTGCQKTTYGVAVATATSEKCPQEGTTTAPPPSMPPPLPPPSTP